MEKERWSWWAGARYAHYSVFGEQRDVEENLRFRRLSLHTWGREEERDPSLERVVNLLQGGGVTCLFFTFPPSIVVYT